jgi:hypothetical protein
VCVELPERPYTNSPVWQITISIIGGMAFDLILILPETYSPYQYNYLFYYNLKSINH